MLPNKKSLNSVETEIDLQQEGSLDLNKTTQNLSNSDIANDHKKLKERMTDLLKGDTEFSKMKQGDKILVVSTASGLFTAVLPLLAVGATLAIPGAIVGLALYFAVKVAVKAVQSGYKGLKWSAEKTVDGAKYTAGKIKDGAVHAKDKVVEGVDSLKKRFKERDRVVFYNHAKEGAAIEKMTKFPEKDRKKAGEIKHELKAIFADKGDNSKLVKNILSGISLKIDLKIAEEAKSESREHTPKWQVQKDFIKHLGEKDLRVLIKQKALPSDVYFIDRVFSEHHDEIKEVIAKCKEDHILKGSLKMRNDMFEEVSARSSRSSSLSSSLGGKDSTQSNSLLKSSSLDSVRTESTVSSEAELLNPAKHKEVKAPSSFREKMPSWFGGKKAPEETTNIKYQDLPESGTSSRQVGESTFYVDTPTPIENTDKTATIGANRSRSNSLTPVDPPKVPGSPSIDSGMGSGSSTPSKLDHLSSPDDLRNASAKLQEQGYFGGQERQQAAYVPRKEQEFVVIDMEGGTNSIGYQSGFDSGFNSPTSSPTHAVFTNEDGKAKTQADLKETGHLDKLVGQPSTYKSEIYIELQHPKVTV